MQLVDLLPLAQVSIADPREGMRRLQALALDRATLWQALVATVAVSVLLFYGADALAVRSGAAPMSPLLPGPLASGLVSFAGQALFAVLIYWGGRMLGGTGRFEDALLAVTWLQFVLNALLVVQLVLMLVLPPLAELLGLATLGIAFWLLAGMTAEMHGFPSILRTFAGLIIGLLGLSVVLVIVLLVIGISLPRPPNV